MGKIRQFFLTTLVLLCSALTSWAESYTGGSETPSTISGGEFDGYYAIGTAAELYGFAALINGSEDDEALSAKAVLTADIVVNENVLKADGTLNGTPTYSWTPIGTNSNKFSGTFDGNGHTISGLYFNNTTSDYYPNGGKFVGLIGCANGAVIKNVAVVDSYLRGAQYVGGICGYGYNTNTTITYCYNTGTVSGYSDYVGGICGYDGTETNCYNTGTVSGYSDVGGICGSYGTQTNCYNTGTVSGYRQVGGICSYSGTQTNCYYLEGCGKDGNNVVQYGVGNIRTGQTTADVAGKTTAATTEEFASGKIAYLLNGSTSGDNIAWYQTIGTDAYPVLDKTHAVVYVTQPCTIGFSNTEGAVTPHSSMDELGHCTACGRYTVQGTLVTESNCSSLNLSADFVGYYAINNTAELYWLANEVNNGNATINAVLTADIVVNENVLNADGTLNGTPTYSWTPIGTYDKNYKGIFDGNGHTISGLYFDNTTDGNYPDGGVYVGLIGYANGAAIKNVGVIDSYLKGNYSVGGICGKGSDSDITNCHNTGTVSGSSYYVGGICGERSNSNITNCYSTGTVSGSGYYVGGICGNAGYGTQTNCYYLKGSATNSGGGVSATAEEFASGKIAYLLNGSTSEGNIAWRQTLGDGNDAYPVLDKTHAVVYATTAPCHTFSNTEGPKEHSPMDKTGRCTDCGQFIAQEPTLVTESNYSSFNLTADFIGYYAISNPVDLYWFANEVNSGNTTIKNAVLTADIVVNEKVLKEDGTLNGTPTYSWTPIGTNSKKYTGTFDGNGHTISGLYFNNTTDGYYPAGGCCVGLIGYAYTATIKNVGVIDSYIRGYQCVGGICGDDNSSKITNCYNTGTVSGSSQYVGGICGYSLTTNITNCYNTGTVSGDYYVGGICGCYGTQNNCYNTGTVSGYSSSYSHVGGICGANGTQTYCYNTGTVSGYKDDVGGICGNGGTQNNCYYLAGCGSKNTLGVSTTAEKFASGYVAYWLNGSFNGKRWRQTLFADASPVFDATHNAVTGYIDEKDGVITVYGDLVLTTNYEIAEGKTLLVPANATVTTTGTAVITNNGTLRANGTLSGNNLAGNGTFITNRVSLCSISNLNESYVYKSTAYTLEDGLSGVAVNTTILGKTFTLDATISPSYTNNRNAGTATISWTNSADENDVLSGQFEITPKTLAISNIKAENKVYDGNTTTTVSYTADVFDGDKVTFGTDATFADKNVGNGKAVSFNYTKSGADAANYAFATTTGTTTANIEQRELEFSSITAAGKVYDGNTTTTVAIAASNIVSGDVVNFGTAAAFENKNVGTNKTVNFNFTKSGADAANYSFAQATGTAKANITAKNLTLSNFTASNKTFDGTTNATGGAFSDDRVSGDALEFSFNYAFANMNAANAVAVNFSNITISGGADKDNYTLLTTTGTCSAKISPVTDEVVLNFTMPTRTVMYNGQANRYEMPTADELFSTNNDLYRMYGGFQPADNDAFQAARANVLAQTEVGEYTFGYNSGTLVNTSANFTNVKFNVTDGKLVITPNTNVVVTITENSSELTYNTEEQRVEGYTYSINDELNIYSEEDFTFSGNDVATGTTVGTYPMELSAADFSNTNTNFADVRFVIVDGALTINKAAEAPNKPSATIETRYINTQLVALPADWAWSEYTALAMGSNTATANYTGADKGNYVIESIEVTIIRGECLHNEGNEVLYTLEPTCTHKGYTGNLSCKLCGVVYEMGDSIPALGHDFVNTVVVPTCTTEGYTVHLCNRCQFIEYSDTVPAAGHKADSVAIENVVAATSTSVATYDSVIYCSVCKAEISRKKVYVTASSMAVSKQPSKVEYKQGEKLDVKGGKVTVSYSDNSTADFEMLAGWVSGFDSQKVGKQQLTVTFDAVSSTLTATFSVTVKEADDDTQIDEASAEISIYAYNSTIVVEAADAITGEIEVFDVNGRMVVKTLAAGSRTEIQMQRQGLYIVRVGNQAKRIVVY